MSPQAACVLPAVLPLPLGSLHTVVRAAGDHCSVGLCFWSWEGCEVALPSPGSLFPGGSTSLPLSEAHTCPLTPGRHCPAASVVFKVHWGVRCSPSGPWIRGPCTAHLSCSALSGPVAGEGFTFPGKASPGGTETCEWTVLCSWAECCLATSSLRDALVPLLFLLARDSQWPTALVRPAGPPG